jgi:hypothetical protein
MTYEPLRPINIENSDPSEVPEEEPSIRLPPISRIRIREIHNDRVIEREADDIEMMLRPERVMRNLREFRESDNEERKVPYTIGETQSYL